MCYHRPLPQSQGCEPAEHLSWYRTASSVCLRFIKTCRLSGNLHLTPLIQKTDVVYDGLYKFWSSDKMSLFPGWCVYQSWCCWRLHWAFKLYISYRCVDTMIQNVNKTILWSIVAVFLGSSLRSSTAKGLKPLMFQENAQIIFCKPKIFLRFNFCLDCKASSS